MAPTIIGVEGAMSYADSLLRFNVKGEPSNVPTSTK